MMKIPTTNNNTATLQEEIMKVLDPDPNMPQKVTRELFSKMKLDKKDQFKL